MEVAARESGPPKDAGRGGANLSRQILGLAVPALATLVTEPLLVLADSAIVGHLSTDALAGLGLAANILGLSMGLCIFLAYGTTATVARRLGADDRAGALAAGLDGIALAVMVGVGLAVVLVVGASGLVGLYQASPDVARAGAIYLRVSALGLPAALVLLASTGVLRGLQDTRTPLAVALGTGLLNVALSVTLVYVAGLGVAGAATGTVVAQYLGSGVLTAAVLRAAAREGARLRFRPGPLLAAARQGGWLMLRTAELQAAITLATVIAAGLGVTALAAHQVLSGLWNLLALALDALAIAAQALVGKQLGAGAVDRVRAVSRRMLAWGAVAGIALGVLLAAAHPLYLWLFTPDAAVRRLVAAVLIVFALVAVVNGAVFVLDGILIGAGDARYLALSGLFAVATFAVLAAVVHATGAGLVWLWTAYCGFMLARLVTLWLRYRTPGWLRVGV